MELIDDEEQRELDRQEQARQHGEITQLLKQLIVCVNKPEDHKDILDGLNKLANKIDSIKPAAPQVTVTSNQDLVIKEIQKMGAEINSSIKELIVCLNKPKEKCEYEFEIGRDLNNKMSKIKITQK